MQSISADQNTKAPAGWLSAKAAELGFDLCAVIPAAELAPPEHFAEWLECGFAGEMRYLHDPRRANPAAVLPEARSAIVCAVNYNPPAPYSIEAVAQAALGSDAAGPKAWISRYAWGDDYHRVVGEKLEQFVAALRAQFGGQFGEGFAARAYVDTGPISERMAAKLAGLGWLGKNTCLINRDLGSWLFLGVILTSVDLQAAGDSSRAFAPDLCGQCSLCLDACPTGALVEPYVLDARRCISYLTIELRGSIPEELRGAVGWQVFGCDICQDVCPWNRAAPATSLPGLGDRSFSSDNKPASFHRALAPEESDARVVPSRHPMGASNHLRLQAPELLWLLGLSEEEFRSAFRGSAVRRAKWRGLIRNACVAAGNALRQAGPMGNRVVGDTEEDGSGGKQAPGNGSGRGLSSVRWKARARLKAKLAELADSADALIAEHARWALAQEPSGAAPSGGSAGSPARAPVEEPRCAGRWMGIRIHASPGASPTSKLPAP